MLKNVKIIKPLKNFRKTSGPDTKVQQQASHLMDLLDISLGAASISGPSQSTDPWGMPVSDGSKQVR